eukprot:Em0001g81a
MLSEMLQKGVIKKSASPWASPISLAQKKDGITRFCVDYRKINTVTRRDAYPIPWIDDTLDTFSGSKWFSTLDLISGAGQKNCNADAMSRIPCQQCGREDTEPTAGRKCLSDDDVKGKYLETRRLVQIWDQLLIQGGILYRRFENHRSSMEYVLQVVVPRSMRKGILEELHAGVSGGHLGESKMLGRLKECYYWPGRYADVKSWCKTCDLCTTRKTAAPKQKAPLQTFGVGSPMQLVAKEVKEQPKNPKHTGKGYGDKLQLEEIDDDTMVQAPLDLDLPARDVLQEDIPPAQDMLDHDEDPLPVMDNPVQQRDEDDLAITEENEDPLPQQDEDDLAMTEENEDPLPVMDNSVQQGDEDDLAITEENEDLLPVMDNSVQQGDEDDLAITEENEQEED